ncbi:MAG TPA: hypothetical protein VIG57_03165, partial [Candidatus Entotheonella sp.]
LKRVFDIDMKRCPRCYQGALRRIAAISEPSRHPPPPDASPARGAPPPIAPARLGQEPFAWVLAYITEGDGMFGPETEPRCVGSAHYPFAPHGAHDGEGRWGRL